MRSPVSGAISDRGLVLNCVSVVFNAISIVVAKVALTGINPFVSTLIICLCSALLGLLFCYYKGESFSQVDIRRLVLVASLNAGAIVCLYLAISILDPFTIGLVGRLYIVFAILMSAFVLKESFSRLEYFLIACTFAGTLMFVGREGAVVSGQYLGITLALAYTFLFALANLIVKKSIHKVSSGIILFYNNLFGTIACLVILMVTGDLVPGVRAMEPGHFMFASLAAALTFLSLIFFFDSFRFLSFKVSNLIRSLSPIAVAVVSFPFFPVQLSAMNIGGAVIAFVSVVLLTLEGGSR